MALTFREILLDVVHAICGEMVRILDTQGPHGPLRRNSALRKQLLSSEAVQVAQQRGAGGQFGTWGLTVLAQEYIQWLDTGRKPGGKKVPIQALIQFVRNRGLNRGKGGRFTGAKSINAIAFAIQTAIYLRGTQGRHFINPAWAAGGEVLNSLLDEHALDILAKDIETALEWK